MPQNTRRFNKSGIVIGLLLVPLFVTSCAAVAPSGDYISEADTQACDEFFSLTNPYDGSNESLWDEDSMGSYQSDVEYAAQFAEETDLVDYFSALDSALDDVITAQTDGSSKSDVESWMSDVESAESDLSSQCDVVMNP